MKFTALRLILFARGYLIICIFLPMMSYVFSLNLLRSDRPSPPVFFAYMLLVPALFLPLLLVSIERQLSVLRSLPYSKRSLSATLLLTLSGIPAGVAACVGLFSAAVFPLVVGRTDLQTSWFFLSAAGPFVFLFGSIPFSRVVVLELLRRAFPHARLSVHQILLLQTLLAVTVFLALLLLVPQRSIPGVMLVVGALFFPLLFLRPNVYAYKLRPMDTAQKPGDAKVSGLPNVFRKPVWSSTGMWFLYGITFFFGTYLFPDGKLRTVILTAAPYMFCFLLAVPISEYATSFFTAPRAYRQLPVKRSTQVFRLSLSLLATPVPLTVYIIAVTDPGVSAFLGEYALEVPSVFRGAPESSLFFFSSILMFHMFCFVALQKRDPSLMARLMRILPLMICAYSLTLPSLIPERGVGHAAGHLILFAVFLGIYWFLIWRMLGNSLTYRRHQGSKKT